MWEWPRAPPSFSTSEQMIRGTGTHPRLIRVGIGVFSDTNKTGGALWRRRSTSTRLSGVSVLSTQDFGAQPGDRNPLGFKDVIGQPGIEGCGVDSLPARAFHEKAGSSFRYKRPRRSIPVALGLTFWDGARLRPGTSQSLVGTFNRFLRSTVYRTRARAACREAGGAAGAAAPR